MAERTLQEEMEIISICSGKEGYRNYPGSGGLWSGTNNGIADAQFVDWGLARAVATVLNAIQTGELVPRKNAHSSGERDV